MIDKIIIYSLSALAIIFGGYAVKGYFTQIELDETKENYERAVIEYESLLTTKPFEAINIERSDHANEEINQTLSNITSSDDNSTEWL